jgi:CrcB protein
VNGLLTWIGVALAGGCGALARLFVVEAVVRAASVVAPVGVLVVNLSGTLIIGVLAGAGLSGDARLVVVSGFLGAYTTFSTWMVQTDELLLTGRGRWAVGNLVGSLVLGFGAVALGVAIG